MLMFKSKQLVSRQVFKILKFLFTVYVRSCIVSSVVAISILVAVQTVNLFKDVRAHCYCAFLLRTLFIRHARATSYIKRAHRVKTSTKYSADGCCVNLVREYFCWMHGGFHLYFGRSLPFLIISIITKNKTILCVGSCNYFAFTIQMGSNCYIIKYRCA